MRSRLATFLGKSAAIMSFVGLISNTPGSSSSMTADTVGFTMLREERCEARQLEESATSTFVREGEYAVKARVGWYV